ncbi:MAG: hypothetical protein K2N88_05610 [Muribaculaceae bacterium]|nr:hypothetical protein [Muribaculaceae bacterium]
MAKINIEQFAILNDKAPSEGLSFKVNLGFKAARNAKRIACKVSVEFLHDERTILKLGINCEFDIFSEDWDNLIKDKVLIISKDDLGFFANQTIGVARGIMFAKTEDSEFRNFILPPIDLTTILKEDLVINISETNT